MKTKESKIYEVTVRYENTMEVTASSEDEALEIAGKINMEDWENSDMSTQWEVEEFEDNGPWLTYERGEFEGKKYIIEYKAKEGMDHYYAREITWIDGDIYGIDQEELNRLGKPLKISREEN